VINRLPIGLQKTISSADGGKKRVVRFPISCGCALGCLLLALCSFFDLAAKSLLDCGGACSACSTASLLVTVESAPTAS
jgi:hypothetical protein